MRLMCQGPFGRLIASREPIRQDSEIARVICTLIGEAFGLDASRLRLTDRVQDLQLEDDSFGAMELVMALEERFSIAIPDDALARVVTIGDLVKHVERELDGWRNIPAADARGRP